MPVSAVVTESDLQNFISVTDSISKKYAAHLEGWTESPFAWILTLPSRSRGAAGEEIVSTWLTAEGFKVTRSGHSDCDRIVNGKKVEIKFSTLWKSGGYKFQQLRDQDYESVFCLGISPDRVHGWLIPKAVAWQNSRPQHGGQAGVDTRWLCFPAQSPPVWMRAYGGTLAELLHILRGKNEGHSESRAN